MAHAEQKQPKPSKLPVEARKSPQPKTSAQEKPDSERKQHAAYGYKNHEDYPEGADASDAPAKRWTGAPADQADAETPNRRRRDPKP